jgi:hypothetical protein
MDLKLFEDIVTPLLKSAPDLVNYEILIVIIERKYFSKGSWDLIELVAVLN